MIQPQGPKQTSRRTKAGAWSPPQLANPGFAPRPVTAPTAAMAPHALVENDKPVSEHVAGLCDAEIVICAVICKRKFGADGNVHHPLPVGVRPAEDVYLGVRCAGAAETSLHSLAAGHFYPVDPWQIGVRVGLFPGWHMLAGDVVADRARQVVPVNAAVAFRRRPGAVAALMEHENGVRHDAELRIWQTKQRVPADLIHPPMTTR